MSDFAGTDEAKLTNEERSVSDHDPQPQYAWRPSVWLHALAATAPASAPLWRSVRAAVTVGGPMLVGAIAGDVLIGMWISMGTLLLAAGENDGPYAQRFQQIAVVTPIAAAAYFFGMLSAAPAWVVIAVMAAAAFASGIASGLSSVLSIATMQGLLIAALAIGVPAAKPSWQPAVLFLIGAFIYCVLLAVEALLTWRRPDRLALQRILDALADLAQRQADGGQDLTSGRQRVIAALDAFDRTTIQHRRYGQGPMVEFDHAAMISRAADQLLARLMAADAVAERSAAAADRLRRVAAAVADGRRLDPLPDDGSLLRVRVREAAIWTKRGTAHTPARPRRPLTWPGPAVVTSAIRLAVVTGAAYAVFLLTPLPRGYWIPLTVALVMKPDLGSVFARAVTRSAGTVIGAVFALLLGLLLTGDVLLSGAVVVLSALLPWATAHSYAFKAVLMTPLIMIMIAAVEPSGGHVDALTGARILATLVGGALVIVLGYLVWPSARHPDIAGVFSRALVALSAYADTVSAGDADDVAVSAARRSTYRALSDTGAAVQRTLAEPPPAGAEACAWLPVVSAAERVADRITDLSARVRTADRADDAAMLAALAARVARLAGHPVHILSQGRGTSLITLADDATDPSVRALADEIAALEGMLERPGAGSIAGDDLRVTAR